MGIIDRVFDEVGSLLDYNPDCSKMSEDILVLEQNENKVILVFSVLFARTKEYCNKLLTQLCKSGFDVVGNVYKYGHCIDEYCPTELADLPCVLLTL